MIRSRRDVLALLGGLVPASVVSRFPLLRPRSVPNLLSTAAERASLAAAAGGPNPGEYRGVFSLRDLQDSHITFDGWERGVCSRCGLTETEIKAKGINGKCRGSHAA